jgi:hypothetical protein
MPVTPVTPFWLKIFEINLREKIPKFIMVFAKGVTKNPQTNSIAAFAACDTFSDTFEGVTFDTADPCYRWFLKYDTFRDTSDQCVFLGGTLTNLAWFDRLPGLAPIFLR